MTALRNDTFDVIDVLGTPAAIEVVDAPDGVIVVGTPSGGAGAGAVLNLGGVTGVLAVTEAEYAAIETPDPTVLYVVTA